MILQAGHRSPKQPGTFFDGPQFASTYTSPGDPSQYQLTYGRFHNPTWTAWEDALGVLEDGHAISFASGMAAIAAVFGVCLKPGDVVVLPSDSYYTTRVVASNWLQTIGIQVRLASTRDNAQAGFLDGASLLWLETPSNPQLELCDIHELAQVAHGRGVLVAVDNTTATAYLQQPLVLGADYVVAADTKALTGHSDVVLGHVATADAERASALRTWRTQPAVQAVYYPGLPNHPGHAVARRQMRAFGSVVSFDLGTRARAEAFLQALTLVREATSFGGVHSTAERRARWGGDDISEGFIRFSVGCEATQDILDDVGNALDVAG
jgi:cystathionine gamma-lyase